MTATFPEKFPQPKPEIEPVPAEPELTPAPAPKSESAPAIDPEAKVMTFGSDDILELFIQRGEIKDEDIAKFRETITDETALAMFDNLGQKGTELQKIKGMEKKWLIVALNNFSEEKIIALKERIKELEAKAKEKAESQRQQEAWFAAGHDITSALNLLSICQKGYAKFVEEREREGEKLPESLTPDKLPLGIKERLAQRKLKRDSGGPAGVLNSAENSLNEEKPVAKFFDLNLVPELKDKLPEISDAAIQQFIDEKVNEPLRKMVGELGLAEKQNLVRLSQLNPAELAMVKKYILEMEINSQADQLLQQKGINLLNSMATLVNDPRFSENLVARR